MLLLAIFLQSSFALETLSPVVICQQRMMSELSQKRACTSQARGLKLDPHAASACNAINDDQKFLNCWQNVAGGVFNSEALDRCVESPEDSDDEIFKCILSLKNKRIPASLPAPKKKR